MGTPGYWYTTQLHVPVCILCLCDCKYARMCSLTCKGQKTVSGVSLFYCHVCHASWSSGFQGLSPFCSHFSIETLGLQMLPLAVRLLHTCGIWAQVLVLFNSKCSHPLSHLPSPLRSSSTAMNPPFKGLPLIWPLHLAPRTLASRNRFSLFTVIQFLANLTCLQNAVSTEYCSMYTAPSKFSEQHTRRKTSHWTHV